MGREEGDKEEEECKRKEAGKMEQRTSGVLSSPVKAICVCVLNST